MQKFQHNLIRETFSAMEALNALDNTGGYTNLFVLDEAGMLIGSVTDGDIRRGFINGYKITDMIGLFMNKDFKSLHHTRDDFRKLKEYRSKGYKLLPIVDDNNHLIRIIALDRGESHLPLEAIIMAGGMGQRLHPLTLHTPKPLLKIADKPIIEYNIDRLIQFGVRVIYISVKYLAEQIMDYFGDGSAKGIEIRYLLENEPLGTIGAVSQIGNFCTEDILVMNSDLLTNIDFEDFYISFKEKNADLAIATVPYHVDIPYAVLELSDESEVVSFKEKPRYTYYSNAGIYLINKNCCSFIPHHKRYDATDMIADLMTAGKKVISEPILSYWLDIGKMEDFNKAQTDIKHLNF